jgi:hypothetical protein
VQFVANAFDFRIVRVGVQINNRLKIYEGLAIKASGARYASSTQNDCEVQIANLDAATRAYLATETSPANLNKTPKILTLDAGRQSYGTGRIFVGNISSVEIAQPPDIWTTLKCLTGNYQKGNVIARSYGASAPLSTIAQQVAKDLDLNLIFQANEKNIANYAFNGGALKQVDYLGKMGGTTAFIDNESLIVKDAAKPLANRLRILNADSGLIGVPTLTDEGIKVKFFLDTETTLGGVIQVQSKINPALNGNYSIYKLSFELASRDIPFDWTAEAKRL